MPFVSELHQRGCRTGEATEKLICSERKTKHNTDNPVLMFGLNFTLGSRVKMDEYREFYI